MILIKLLLRSGTTIGTLVRKAEHGQSKLYFLHNVNSAFKEANEILYWLSLLKDTNYVEKKYFSYGFCNRDGENILQEL
ncbi:MAG: four helix bundle protein [Chitinophagaceae bacterium]|nr:four helix bundle protein [Chitinophagaceae bacterium]